MIIIIRLLNYPIKATYPTNLNHSFMSRKSVKKQNTYSINPKPNDITNLY